MSWKFDLEDELFDLEDELFDLEDELFDLEDELFDLKDELFDLKDELFDLKDELQWLLNSMASAIITKFMFNVYSSIENNVVVSQCHNHPVDTIAAPSHSRHRAIYGTDYAVIYPLVELIC